MTRKSDLVAYKARLEDVSRFIEKERRFASVELRWKQLNSAYLMAKSLGLSKSERDEKKVYQIWAGLKEKSIRQTRKN